MTARMADALRHRGPDDSGVWVNHESGIALGHRRLSIIDLSSEGQQPMHSADGRYVITFNGEIYNHRALRAELEELGHAFRGHSDTEVMLGAITQWDLEPAIKRFVGMFGFALWDRVNRALYLVRDRLGIKPLYYGWCGSTLLFGSELKSFRLHPAFRGEIDRSALALYMRHSYVPVPYSIYQGVSKLPPGTILKLGPVQPDLIGDFSDDCHVADIVAVLPVSPVHSPMERIEHALFFRVFTGLQRVHRIGDYRWTTHYQPGVDGVGLQRFR